MSAIIPEDGEVGGPPEQIKVLFTLHPGFDTLDFAGPLEVLAKAQHDSQTKAFKCIFAADAEHTVSAQGASFRAHINFKEAMERLSEFDVVIVPGGGVEEILKAKAQPLGLVKAYADLQIKNPTRERTLMSVCTGAFFLAQQGLLAGLCATTHPDYYTKFENLCKDRAQFNMEERTDVMEERYVVNNLRFELGEDEGEDNPYVRRRSDARRYSLGARKGSNSWRESNTRRESIAKRAQLKLGGLRVITSGGITTGIDAALYLVSALVSHEVANEAARVMQYEWHKGVVVKGIDV